MRKEVTGGSDSSSDSCNDEDVKEVEVTDDMPGTQNTDRARLSKNEEIASFNLDD